MNTMHHCVPHSKPSTSAPSYFCLSLSEYFKTKNRHKKLERQDGAMFILLYQGNIELKLGHETCTVSQEQMIIVQPNKLFAVQQYSEDIQGYVLYIQEDSMLGTMGNHSLIFDLEFMDPWSPSLFEVGDLPVHFLYNIFARVAWQYTHKPKELTIVNSYLITLLLEINGLYNEMVHTNRAAIELCRKFKREVNNHMQSQLAVSEFAEILAVTPNHLNKSVKSVTGDSASQLINKIRVIEAKYLLMHVHLNIADIASQLGYTDISYFSRFFKKHVGVTPTVYRKMIDLS